MRLKKYLISLITFTVLFPLCWLGFWLNHMRLLFMSGWIRAECFWTDLACDKIERDSEKQRRKQNDQ